jgi:hypothetical protein
MLARLSDAEIVHALLLKADSFLKGESAGNIKGGPTLEPLSAYQSLKKACIDYLRTVFATEALLVTYEASSACYEISISSLEPAKTGHIWRI